MVKESVRQLEVLVDRICSAGTSLRRDVVAFMFDGLDVNNPDSATEQKTNDQAATSSSPSISATLASAEADAMTVSNFLWRYDILFGTVRDLYVVFACLLEVATVIDTRNATRATEAKSYDVQDIENDATPVKARTNSCNHTDTVIRAIQKVFALEPVLVKLIEQHPIPYMVTVTDWADSMCVISTAPSAILALHAAYAASVNSSSNTTNNTIPLYAHYTTIKQSLNAHFEQVGQAQVSHYSQCMIDSVMRQDWPSHSKYMRDKKLTHGIIALCTTMRQTIYEMYQQHVHYCDNTMPCCANMLKHDSVDVLALQMLLSTAILVGRTYLGHYDTIESNSSITDVCNTLLAPSRVRTAQWRKDQYYFVSMVVETVVWIVSQCSRHNSNADGVAANAAEIINNGGDDSGGGAVGCVKGVLRSAAYVVQAAVVSEIVAVLRYMLLALYISTHTDGGGVIKNLTSIVSGEAGAGAGGYVSSGDTSASNDLYDSLVQLVQCLSTGDYLLDYAHLQAPTTTAFSATDSLIASYTDPPATPQLIPPTRHYDVYGDMHTHSGMFRFHINPSGAGVSVYQTELAAATSASGGVSDSSCVTSAQRAVAFGRVESMCITNPRYLLALLSTDVELCCAVHCEIHPSDDLCETSQIVTNFMRLSLSRRYELNPATYPALTSQETAAAIVVQDFIAALPV